MAYINEVITDSSILANRYVLRDGYVFTSINYPHNVFDALLIRCPRDTKCFSPRLPQSERSLDEHIALVNELKLKKALIIAESIDFITACPTLEHLRIAPSDSAKDGFDYSPLYKMPMIKSLSCSVMYGAKKEFSASVDCSEIKELESIHITNAGYKNFNAVKTLKSLALSDYDKTDLSEAFGSTELDTLSVFQSKIKTLEGIQKSQKMQCLYLYYNRSLQDISVLKKVKRSLRALRIENCPKINDFSVLGELENLELLELSGSNSLPDLSFIKSLKKLKTFVFSVNVIDGDLTPCLELEYVYSGKNRKHYNLKDCDLPKGNYTRGNETIEEWRREE